MVCNIGTDEQRQADIDRITIKNPGERFRQNDTRPIAFELNSACSRLEPQPKFLPATIISPDLNSLGRIRVDTLHGVLSDIFGINQFQILPRVDLISIEVMYRRRKACP